MKYVNANLKSYKEFIQRMLNGEVFCKVTSNAKNEIFSIDKYYFCNDSFIEILDGGGQWEFNPCKISIKNLKIITGDDNE